ncbi:MAG: phosphoribosyl-AMP cyclohydrolase [Thermodesulfobacteriota bacterium]|nr:phosphoribosyl-AMP cyclohydrolase [Thermodesulfobacteriota bacterium]
MVELDFEKGGGILPAIVQDFETNEVLMLAYVNRESFDKTVETGKATYWSRSRNTLWVKGETSGNLQLVREIRIDCDSDTILFKVEQKGGAACHEGYRSCFYRSFKDGKTEIVGEKIFDPEEVYGK